MKHLFQRLALGTFASFFALLIIWFSPEPLFSPFFALILAFLITLAVSEFFLLAHHKNYQPLVKIGLVGCFFYALSIYASIHYPGLFFAPYLILLSTLIAAFIHFFYTGSNPLVNLSITSLAFVYLAIPLSTWFSIAYFFPKDSLQEGRWWLFYLLAVTKVNDIGAYFIGSGWGKHKMTPYISPGKSWEGAIAGLFFGIITSLTFYFLTPFIPIQMNLLQSLGLGLILSVSGQFGDLAESLIKRDVGVKNSSHIPGLGGILDMFDSLVFASPLLFLFLKIQNG